MDSFTALADPMRRSILEMLGHGPRGAGEIVTFLQQDARISAPAVSQHLKALREAGLVRVRVDGQRRIYSLDPAGLDAMDAWIARVRGFWAGRLDALEQALREEDGDE
ncbi:ArsR/SmtB family transcription factor [Niveispirillum fermenti]|uniref:ArsR/SmtB family transcription factor n=1 Tax=Niveispirillum fermenti TaxID=1233113 RepID=UPI003A8BC781